MSNCKHTKMFRSVDGKYKCADCGKILSQAELLGGKKPQK